MFEGRFWSIRLFYILQKDLLNGLYYNCNTFLYIGLCRLKVLWLLVME